MSRAAHTVHLESVLPPLLGPLSKVVARFQHGPLHEIHRDRFHKLLWLKQRAQELTAAEQELHQSMDPVLAKILPSPKEIPSFGGSVALAQVFRQDPVSGHSAGFPHHRLAGRGLPSWWLQNFTAMRSGQPGTAATAKLSSVSLSQVEQPNKIRPIDDMSVSQVNSTLGALSL